MPGFDSDVVDAMLAHVNDDLRDDNVVIVRAFAGRDADAAVMSDLDGRGGTWRYTFEGEEHELHVPWAEELTEHPQVRRQIFALYDAACEQLGVEPRAH